MTKYNGLKEDVGNDIEGVKFQDSYSAFNHRKGKITLIRGFPACPECSCVLERIFNLEQWNCNTCGTVWSTNDLVNAIMIESALVATSIRNLRD